MTSERKKRAGSLQRRQGIPEDRGGECPRPWGSEGQSPPRRAHPAPLHVRGVGHRRCAPPPGHPHRRILHLTAHVTRHTLPHAFALSSGRTSTPGVASEGLPDTFRCSPEHPASARQAASGPASEPPPTRTPFPPALHFAQLPPGAEFSSVSPLPRPRCPSHAHRPRPSLLSDPVPAPQWPARPPFRAGAPLYQSPQRLDAELLQGQDPLGPNPSPHARRLAHGAS